LELTRAISRARTDLVALYAAKVMHGLCTPAMDKGAWKASVYWAKYKPVDFQAMFIALCEDFDACACSADSAGGEGL